MKIVETEQFKFELEEIINFIKQDKIVLLSIFKENKPKGK